MFYLVICKTNDQEVCQKKKEGCKVLIINDFFVFKIA